jgi:hypothetical protein
MHCPFLAYISSFRFSSFRPSPLSCVRPKKCICANPNAMAGCC